MWWEWLVLWVTTNMSGPVVSLGDVSCGGELVWGGVKVEEFVSCSGCNRELVVGGELELSKGNVNLALRGVGWGEGVFIQKWVRGWWVGGVSGAIAQNYLYEVVG